MTQAQRTGPDTSREFFENLYANEDDPWNFRNSAYERLRYDSIISDLSDSRYRYAFEPGCSIGELTARLAALCDGVLAIDCANNAIERARLRCSKTSNIELAVGALPACMPDKPCDLIVFSEIGYYFERSELQSLIKQLWQLLEPGGRFLASHWLGYSDDHRIHGYDVQEVILLTLARAPETHLHHRDFLLQRWTKPQEEKL